MSTVAAVLVIVLAVVVLGLILAPMFIRDDEPMPFLCLGRNCGKPADPPDGPFCKDHNWSNYTQR